MVNAKLKKLPGVIIWARNRVHSLGHPGWGSKVGKTIYLFSCLHSLTPRAVGSLIDCTETV